MKDKEELKEELELYKERLEKAMSAGNLAWWEMELPSGKVRFNDRKAEMLGYQPERFENYTDFTDLVHPDDYKRAMKAMRDHLEGRKERYEVEYRIEKKDGDYKWFRDVGSITEENEGYKKVAGIVIDIDKRKDAEEREDLLNSLLRHDIKNKAQIVQGYLQLLEEDLSEDTKDLIEKALNANKASINLIAKVRLLLGAQKEEKQAVNLASTIRDAVDSTEALLDDKGMDILISCPSTECKVLGGSLLKEVFTNIIENCAYHSGGTTIKISDEITEDEVTCMIEDDGKGIPDDKKEIIFEKGFTTDEKRGTGLGMFLVRMLLESYGGCIEVKDSEMGGARFDVRLKRSQTG